jgi:hypothetical protein
VSLTVWRSAQVSDVPELVDSVLLLLHQLGQQLGRKSGQWHEQVVKAAEGSCRCYFVQNSFTSVRLKIIPIAHYIWISSLNWIFVHPFFKIFKRRYIVLQVAMQPLWLGGRENKRKTKSSVKKSLVETFFSDSRFLLLDGRFSDRNVRGNHVLESFFYFLILFHCSGKYFNFLLYFFPLFWKVFLFFNLHCKTFYLTANMYSSGWRVFCLNCWNIQLKYKYMHLE